MAVILPPAQAIWLNDVLIQGGVRTQTGGSYPSWRTVRQTFPGTAAEFTSFMKQPAWRKIRAAGLLLV